MSLVDTKQFERRIFNGKWVAAAAGVPVREPATGAILFESGLAGKGEIAAAAKVARAAQRAWAAKPHEERSAIFRKAADLFEQQGEAITPLLMRETGSIPPKIGVELHMAAGICREAAAMLTQPRGLMLPADGSRLSIARRVPHGVVGIISPFNFPLILSIRAVAPGSGRGQHRGAQARPAHADYRRLSDRARVRRGGPACGLPERAAWRRGSRRGLVHRSEYRDGVFHRFDRGRPQGRRTRRPPPEEGHARTRRQEFAGGARRRRCRNCRLQRGLGRVSASGPDLHDDRARIRARQSVRCAHRAAGGEGAASARGRSVQGPGGAGADHRRAADRAHRTLSSPTPSPQARSSRPAARTKGRSTSPPF